MAYMRLMHAKLHRFAVTDANVDYVGSITIAKDLLEAVGLLPLQEVEVVNLRNGERWSTYVLPGPASSGCICPNGGGALLCAPGDVLVIYGYELLDRTAVCREGHQAQVAVGGPNNAVRMRFEQRIEPIAEGVEFHAAAGLRQERPELPGPAFTSPMLGGVELRVAP